MVEIGCRTCHSRYPDRELPYLCINCGGIYDQIGIPEFNMNKIEPDLPGIWKFRHTFGLSSKIPIISLGEGNTPLIVDEVFQSKIGWKVEFLNPTSSYKDRGSSILVSFLNNRGVSSAVEDSSGNAGASFAAYAARAGIRATIFIPRSASGPKMTQIQTYGAEMRTISGPRSAAADAVRNEVKFGNAYASHAYLPFGVIGSMTIAFELISQMDSTPGTIIAPVGHGSLLLGLIRGFNALKYSDNISQIPAFIGVQARACAPVWEKFANDNGELLESHTIAEGVSVRNPVWAETLLEEMNGKFDRIITVMEEQIITGRNNLAKRGLYVEPTTAIVWDALTQVVGKVPEPIVIILTGVGYKYGI